MGDRFHQLLHAALSEIKRRDSRFLSAFPLCIPDPSVIAARYARHSQCARYTTDVLERAFSDGFSYLAQSLPNSTRTEGPMDPISEILCESIIDAFAADDGVVALYCGGDDQRPVAQIFVEDYSERHVRSGLRYFV